MFLPFVSPTVNHFYIVIQCVPFHILLLPLSLYVLKLNVLKHFYSLKKKSLHLNTAAVVTLYNNVHFCMFIGLGSAILGHLPRNSTPKPGRIPTSACFPFCSIHYPVTHEHPGVQATCTIQAPNTLYIKYLKQWLPKGVLRTTILQKFPHKRSVVKQIESAEYSGWATCDCHSSIVLDL